MSRCFTTDVADANLPDELIRPTKSAWKPGPAPEILAARGKNLHPVAPPVRGKMEYEIKRQGNQGIFELGPDSIAYKVLDGDGLPRDVRDSLEYVAECDIDGKRHRWVMQVEIQARCLHALQVNGDGDQVHDIPTGAFRYGPTSAATAERQQQANR